MKLKLLLSALLMSASSGSFAAVEDNLKIIEVGGWAQGNPILYIRFDREIGPSSCRDDFVKVNLGVNGETESLLKSKSFIRSLAITGLTANLTAKVEVLDTCLYGNPTISQLYLKR
jgi:hypothetical protein